MPKVKQMREHAAKTWHTTYGSESCGAVHRRPRTDSNGIQRKRNPARVRSRALAIAVLELTAAISLSAQSPPESPNRPWHSSTERQIIADARQIPRPMVRIDPGRTYSLAELIDLAEANNPEARVAWESSLAQAASLGITRSELFPTLSAIALAGADRAEAPFGSQFYRQTIPSYQLSLELSYTIFDFGVRRGRINAESARALASNFGFNDVHRQLIYQVSQAYYQLLNAEGQKEAAGASLVNAQSVQQSAEERLRNGLATRPDVLEARSATAQAQFDLQAVLGLEQIARGDLLTAVSSLPNTPIHVQSLSEVPTPESVAETVEAAISRALEQRPDLQAKAAEIRLAQAELQQARAAYYPKMTVITGAAAQALYLFQQNLPSGQTADLTGGVSVNLNWTIFDGGARRNRVAEAEAHIRQAHAQVNAVRDQIENQVWAAYANLNTAFRQREAARELVSAATESYNAALESYSYGVRNLLDVTNAQKVLAQARSTEIAARTQVLSTLADLAFRTADAIQAKTRKTHL